MSLISVPVRLTAHTPQQKIVNYYTNNRTTPNDDGNPPIQIGKRWTTRLVVDHFFHTRIEERVAEIGPAAANFIGTWQKTVSTVIAELTASGEISKYDVIADNWNKNGPPKEVQMQ